MASVVQYTPGTGGKAHAESLTIGANTGDVPYALLFDSRLPTYTIVFDVGGVANDHVIQIMAGSSLNVRVKSIDIQQSGNLTTAALQKFSIFRLTTAGTGGTAVTAGKSDNGDSAAGATGMTLPTAKGTEAAEWGKFSLVGRQAILATASQTDDRWHWEQKWGAKALIIPAGTANGIAIKTLVTLAGGGISGTIELVETSYV